MPDPDALSHRQSSEDESNKVKALGSKEFGAFPYKIAGLEKENERLKAELAGAKAKLKKIEPVDDADWFWGEKRNVLTIYTISPDEYYEFGEDGEDILHNINEDFFDGHSASIEKLEFLTMTEMVQEFYENPRDSE